MWFTRYGTVHAREKDAGEEVGINSELYSRHTCTFHQIAYRCLEVVVSQHSCMVVGREETIHVENESQRESCVDAPIQKQEPDLPARPRTRQNLINTHPIALEAEQSLV
jgi:hypothetical protein